MTSPTETDGPAGGDTTTVRVSLVASAVSSAMRRRTYVPGAPNVAVETAAFAGAKSTVPGPLSFDHRIARVLPGGSPSSLTVPVSDAPAGRVTATSGPAFTSGAWFAETRTVSSSVPVSRVSLAVRRSTYAPPTLKVAVV